MSARRAFALVFIFAIAVVILILPAATRTTRGAAGQDLFRTETVNGHEAVAGSVIVKFRETANPEALAAVEDQLDADLNKGIGGINARLIHSRSKSAKQLVKELSARPDVEYAEPNYIGYGGAVPNDTQFASLWNLKNTGQTGGTPGAHVEAEGAWDYSTGSRDAVIAVIDSGIDYNHPDLAANVWTAPRAFSVTIGGQQINCPAGSHGFKSITTFGPNVVTDMTCDPMDDHNHGTHVSGTVGAVGNNSNGVVGVNWTASIMASKWLKSDNTGSVADAINAIEFVLQAKQALGPDANVRVLNNSWFIGGFSSAIRDQIVRAEQQGMLFVTIAGNNSSDNEVTPRYPSAYKLPNMINVAATDNRDQLASFSNWGKNTIHLGAPGAGVYSTIRNNSYQFFNGTSMASPHVAGAAALMLSRCTITAAGLKGAILTNADAIPALAGKTMTGGRLNVRKAIAACVASPNIVDDGKFFVRQQYADFLGREPDASGFDFWTNQTTNCGSPDPLVCRINVSAAFFLSPEFQETGFYVIRMQRAAFGRKSAVEGSRLTLAQFNTDARQVGIGFIDGQPGSGAVLEQNKQAYAQQVVTSTQFIARFPTSQTADEYVNALYTSAAITPAAGEVQQAVNAYNAAGGSTAGRVAALRFVTDSTSVRDAEFRAAFVLTQYFGYMRRDPDQIGFDFWLGKLNQFGGNYIHAEMVKAFITSGEYRGRFGPS